MEMDQYPLRIEKRQRDRLQELANKERRSLNQTILLIIDDYLGNVKNAGKKD